MMLSLLLCLQLNRDVLSSAISVNSSFISFHAMLAKLWLSLLHHSLLFHCLFFLFRFCFYKFGLVGRKSKPLAFHFLLWHSFNYGMFSICVTGDLALFETILHEIPSYGEHWGCASFYSWLLSILLLLPEYSVLLIRAKKDGYWYS